MRLIGWIVGVCFSLALIVPGVVGYFLLFFLFAPPFIEAHSRWAVLWTVLVNGVITYALYSVAKRVLFRLTTPWFQTWSYRRLVPYSLISGVAFLALVIWQATFASLLVLNLTYWIGPILFVACSEFCGMFWTRFLEQETAREVPPPWVGEAPPPWIEGAEQDFTRRYLLWIGFTKATVAMGRWFFDLKIGPASKVLGNAKIASVKDTYEAGL
jgi:hypothetical protein